MLFVALCVALACAQPYYAARGYATPAAYAAPSGYSFQGLQQTFQPQPQFYSPYMSAPASAYSPYNRAATSFYGPSNYMPRRNFDSLELQAAPPGCASDASLDPSLSVCCPNTYITHTHI
jgi:hypothetical protein